MNFETSEEQDTAIKDWLKQHKKACKPPATAIGGSYTYYFTPTSLGTVVVVKCFCGKSLDVSDYENW